MKSYKNPEDHIAAIAKEVTDERLRQLREEGWSPSHDDEWVRGELPAAAACYALTRHPAEIEAITYNGDDAWPWGPEWDKRIETDTRRCMIKAAALLMAEIMRIDRAAGEGVM